jgi:hypothetical protein
VRAFFNFVTVEIKAVRMAISGEDSLSTDAVASPR